MTEVKIQTTDEVDTKKRKFAETLADSKEAKVSKISDGCLSHMSNFVSESDDDIIVMPGTELSIQKTERKIFLFCPRFGVMHEYFSKELVWLLEHLFQEISMSKDIARTLFICLASCRRLLEYRMYASLRRRLSVQQFYRDEIDKVFETFSRSHKKLRDSLLNAPVENYFLEVLALFFQIVQDDEAYQGDRDKDPRLKEYLQFAIDMLESLYGMVDKRKNIDEIKDANERFAFERGLMSFNSTRNGKEEKKTFKTKCRLFRNTFLRLKAGKEISEFDAAQIKLYHMGRDVVAIRFFVEMTGVVKNEDSDDEDSDDDE